MINTNKKDKGSYRSFNLLTEDKKKSIENYVFCVGSYKQAANFETINQFILNHIKKTRAHRNNISKSLRSLAIKIMKYGIQEFELIITLMQVKS